MDFSVLNQIAQTNLAVILTIIVVLLVLLIILSLVLLVKLVRAKKRYKMLVNGATGENLEDIIADNIAKLNELIVKNNQLEEKNEEVQAQHAQLEALFARSIQKVAVHRFCAFKDMGGDLSYAVALLDNNNNGVIFSSIFGRQESCTYVKPVNNGVSNYPLSQEENKVLVEAIAK